MVSSVEFKADWHKLPNLLTIARLILSPLPGVIYIINAANPSYRFAAAAIFIVVVVTDVADGYLARRLNLVTTLGKILDPVVDKVLVLATLIAISIENPFMWTPTLIIMLRETSVSLIRVRAKRRGITIAASTSGKIKMVMQSIATTLLLMPLSGGWQLFTFNFMFATVVVTLMSWYDYHRKFCKSEGCAQ
jgi:CDP-diacylglycerol--glycerol-3-phosphate 3-phosphatidyltransferase